ncbi:TPA: pentapeptide repeat-containing protein [Vibrio campbellii]|uniref:pentapeptide repeat-containing protein n=1 Tax=Vibrio campbellii TaxID=680 RepID=UPI00390A510B
MTDFDFCIKRTVQEWNEAAGLNHKSFFLALGQTIINIGVGDLKGSLEKTLETLNAFEFESSEKPPAVLAWELINIALYKSVYELISENEDFIEVSTERQGPEGLADLITMSMEYKSVGINSEFLEYPKDLELLKTIEQPLVDWLNALGIPLASSKAMYLRLKDRFVTNLHMTWINDPQKYLPIESAISSPFIKASKTQREWKFYSNWLQEESNKPVFSEVFGLKQVYVPLRGYYETEVEMEDEINPDLSWTRLKKEIVDAHTDIENWIRNFDKDDAVKLICGGPGSGKSSFAKVLAAQLSEKMPHIRVLFIPLQHFDISGDLTTAIGQYIQDDRYLSINPLDGKNGESRLVIIFDGLDELSMQGQTAADSARSFLDEVMMKINRFNDQNHQRQAIVTGRDIAIQACNDRLRNERQVLHLLPYKINFALGEKHNIIDNDNLIELDQRDIWWEKYSEAKGKNYLGLPQELSALTLEPITKEPLLNYLVALTYERGNIDFSDTVTLNEVYADLLRSVHQRQWDHGSHKGMGNLKLDKFERVLEEVALAIWHGHGRTATLSSIERRCKDSNLLSHLRSFEVSAESGISRLLTAFYFRQSDRISGASKTFEFTHKSFGEYITARRIITLLKKMFLNLERYDEDPDDGFNEKDALKLWIKICGPSPLDEYIVEFLSNEISAQKESTQRNWQKMMQRLLDFCAEKNLPMDEIGGLNYKEMLTYSANSQEAMLVVHNLCAKKTRIKDKLIISNQNIISWISNLQYLGQQEASLAPSSCSYLDLSYGYYESESINCFNLSNCLLNECSFIHCTFPDFNLDGSDLSNTEFAHCYLEDACFNYAILNGSKFERSYLNGASFSFTNIDDSNFFKCDITYCDFEYAVIDMCDFSSAEGDAVEFGFSKIEDTKLSNARITDSVFVESQITNSSFENTNLSRCNFTHSVLNGVSFKNANLDGVNFANAVMNNVDFKGISFDKDTVFDEEHLTYLDLEQEARYMTYMEAREIENRRLLEAL